MKRLLLIFVLLLTGAALYHEKAKVAPLLRAEATTVTQEPSIGSLQELAEAEKRLAEFGGLLLPETMYVVAGRPRDIFFQNIVPVKDPEVFEYHLTGDTAGISMRRRSLHIALPADAEGIRNITLQATEPKGREVVTSTVKLVIVPKDAGQDKKITVLLVGDSLGHQSQFPNALYRLLQQPGNPEATFVGTNHPTGSLVAHEQYGGWTYKDFISLYNADLKTHYRDRSPFMFAPEKEGGAPQFDVKRYLDHDLKGARPDFVHIQLGTNDAFMLKPDDPDFEQSIDQILADADTLIAGIRKALPHAVISVGTVIPSNASDRAFVESYPNYVPLQSEWRWRQVQLKLAARGLKHFAHQESEGVFMVPTHATIDTIDGYSAHSFVPWHETYTLAQAVHPTPIGDEQIAEPIYAGMKAWLAGFNHGQP